MKGNLKMGKEKEKEFFILVMEICIMVIGKMAKGKEGQFIIIVMEIEAWEIILMAIQKENM